MNHTPAQGTGTPRTDKAAFDINADGSAQYSPKGGYIGRDTCEALETELMEARAELESVRLIGNETHHALTAALSSHAEGLEMAANELLAAAKIFEEYAVLHYQKGTYEGNMKAAKNNQHADRFRTAAAALRP